MGSHQTLVQKAIKHKKYTCIQMAAHMRARRNSSMCSLTLCKFGSVEGCDFRASRGEAGAGRWEGQWRWHWWDGYQGSGSGTLVYGRAKEATPRRQIPTPAHSHDHSTALAT